MVVFLAIAAAYAATDGVVLARDGDRLVVEPTAEVPLPGESIGLYLEDRRPDPRSGEEVAGLRYGGDGRVVWTGERLVQIELAYPHQEIAVGSRIVVDAPRGLPPSPAWEPPPAEPPPEQEKSAAERPVSPRLAELSPWGGRTQSLSVGGHTAGDGFGTGISSVEIAWEDLLSRGPGRVRIAVEGLRGARWVEPVDGNEAPSTEVAAGYALWAVVETPAARTAGWAGAAIGVGEQGLAPDLSVGLRRGLPWSDQVSFALTWRSGLGTTGAWNGQISLLDGLRLGLRAAVGDLPRHDGTALRQARAEGELTASVDLSPTLGVDVDGGFAGYDLTLQDVGPVVGLALTGRFGRTP